MVRKKPPVSDAELDVMKVLWEHGPGTVREIDGRLRKQKRRWAYNTVLTLLCRLQTKGYAASKKSAVPYVFRATVSREQLLKQRLSELAETLCDGTASPLVHALVQGQRFSPAEIEEFRKLLDQLQDKKG